MYQMEKVVAFTRTGADGKLKLHEAVATMMDACQFQEYQEEEFRRFLRENHLAVFLFSIQLDIVRMPQFREKITTAVKIYGCKSIYGLRRITMRDEAGELCLIANATGAFFDLEAGKAVKLDPAAVAIKFDDAEPMECLPRKIPVPLECGKEFPQYKVTASELDFNGHLTSSEYLAIAGDLLPENFPFNRVRVEYKRQAKKGETIVPVLHLIDNKAVVDLKSIDGISFAAVEFSMADIR